jgi:halimadienyl-diphosphate synthase
MGTNALWTEHDDRVVADLLSEVSTDDFGQVSPSVYETARLVSTAPWLAGHCARIRFLLATQNHDGGWGAPDGYDVVPTLSATEALLTALRQPESICDLELGAVIRAAADGLRMLSGRLDRHQRRPVPDTIAVELIVPWLVTRLNRHLDELAESPMAGLDPWRGTHFTLPSNVDDLALVDLGAFVHNGHRLPEKVWHSLEVFDDHARQAPFVRPAGGVVCGSPAATAAWLGSGNGHRESAAFLERLQDRHGGPVPGITPIDLFERAWVIAMLVDASVTTTIPHNIVESLQAALTEHGVGAGWGMPVDSDDTAAVLYALARLGRPYSPESLWNYELDDRFSCFPAERTPSISTNAHVLDAFGEYARLDRTPPAQLRAGIDKASAWLLAHQEPDGSWQDKWHASPYYATMCCTLALTRFGGSKAREAVETAVSWVLGTQRADGSWGRWEGTVEETAYAVQLLLHANAPWSDEAVALAAFHGQGFLRQAGDTRRHPPLWHDKDLYTPIAVVRAARLAALNLAAHRTDVAAVAGFIVSDAERS